MNLKEGFNVITNNKILIVKYYRYLFYNFKLVIENTGRKIAVTDMHFSTADLPLLRFRTPSRRHS